MKIIPRKDIDIDQWNRLVHQEETTLCDFSWYMDVVCENWFVYVDEEYTKGIAFATTTRMGIENVTIPSYVRQNRFYGNWSEEEIQDFVTLLQSQFKGGILQVDRQITGKKRTTQIVRSLQLSNHAKRNIKKAEKAQITTQISNDILPSYQITIQELASKIDEFNSKNQQKLLHLLEALQKEGRLIIREILLDEQIVGGLFFVKGKSQDSFIKGSANELGKKNGGMYLAMKQQIEATLADNKVFDFDGSDVPGVKRFNHYFGAKNEYYYQIQWDNNPFWYRLIKKIYVLLK